jgi:hypothetical protein
VTSPEGNREELERRMAELERYVSLDSSGRMRLRHPARGHALVGVAVGLVLVIVEFIVGPRTTGVILAVQILFGLALLVVALLSWLLGVLLSGPARRRALPRHTLQRFGAAVLTMFMGVVVMLLVQLIALQIGWLIREAPWQA